MANLVDTRTKIQEPSRYALALRGKCFMEMERADAVDEIIDIVGRSINECGQRKEMEAKDLNLLSNNILSEIGIYFKTCTVEDLRLLMHNGVRKEYGEFFGLNVATVNQWMKAYIRSEQRVKALRESEKKNIEPVMTQHEAEEAFKATAQKQFKHFKETGVLEVDGPNHLYMELENRAILQVSAADKWANYAEACYNISEQKKAARVKVNATLAERNACTSYINRSKLDQLTDREKMDIVQEAKFISIRKFYEGIEKLEL